MHRKVAAHLSTLAVGFGLGLGAVAVAGSDTPTARSSAATDAQVLRELRKLNANVGTRFRDAPVITQLSDIKRSTKATCESVRPSEHIIC